MMVSSKFSTYFLERSVATLFSLAIAVYSSFVAKNNTLVTSSFQTPIEVKQMHIQLSFKSL